MSALRGEQTDVALTVENVGGIDHTEVEFPPGVTVLTGRNATNRTSLLRSIMAAMGSADVSLKGDADEGRVEMTVGGETYTRTLERANGTVRTGGDPYLEDPTAADLFAFLLETNEARQAVARGDDLRDVIMRPVDTDEIEVEIRQLETEKRELDAELEELETLEASLPELEDERARLRDEIDDVEAELADIEADIEAHSADPETRKAEQSEFETKMEALRDARSDLESLRGDIDTQQRSLEALREDRDQLEADREEYPASVGEDLESLEAEIERRRRRRNDVAAELNELQSVIQFNEELLEGGAEELQDALEDDDDAVTDGLVPEDETVCWTCGSHVGADQIEATVEQLREFRREKRARQRELDEEIEELESEKINYEEKRRQHEQIESELAEIEREIERREQRLAELRERREDKQDRVEELEATVEELEPAEDSELLELHREANELEFELGRLRNDLDTVEAEIDTVEERLEELSDRRERREAVDEELTELRTRIERLEADAVDAFNEHMDAMLELLDYDNLERIWIERVEAEGGRGRSAESAFHLHVVRSTDEGVTYEDSVGHLSESEREVTGLVFALAGYLVHDLAESVPVVLLDSLEAIDSNRIAALVEYFADHADYLVVALLPEDAAALDDEHFRVTDI